MVVAHRWLYRTVVGDVADDLMVLHRCDVPACIRPDHLYVGDHARNMADRQERGRQARLRGESNGMAKVSDAVAAEIVRRRADGALLRELASEFQVSMQTVSRLARRPRATT